MKISLSVRYRLQTKNYERLLFITTSFSIHYLRGNFWARNPIATQFVWVKLKLIFQTQRENSYQLCLQRENRIINSNVVKAKATWDYSWDFVLAWLQTAEFLTKGSFYVLFHLDLATWLVNEQLWVCQLSWHDFRN